MTTVSQLVKHLNTFPPDTLVLVSSDAEGNEYSSVDEASVSFVDSAYSGGRTEDVYMIDDLENEDDYGVNYKKVVVIWPV